MASEKKMVSNFTIKVGLVLFGGCILVPVSLVTLSLYYMVPLQTLTLSVLFSVDSASHDSGRPLCDFSSSRSNVCEMKGDVRIVPGNATVVFLRPSVKRRQQWRIKPHPRKKDGHALAVVTEVTITSTPDAAGNAPGCTARHAAPAVLFSAGGYAGNMFHDFTDVLVPLFVTAARFRSDVHLLAADAPKWWVEKYRPLLRELSRHDVVDMDGERAAAAGEVQCYPHVIVGLRFHKEMSVDANKTAGGYSMADFARLVRRAYGLKRETAIRLGGRDGTLAVEDKTLHPRLLLIARKATRAFTNVGAIRRAAAAVGYEVVVGEPERPEDAAAAAAFAAAVNAADVIVGVHGAGLANLVFLPARAVVVQVVPLGGLEETAREDFGEPAGDMGLGYVQYDIAVNESTLAARYPREHRVLKDPPAVRRDGWLALRSAYLVGQNVTLNVTRFKDSLVQALHLLHR